MDENFNVNIDREALVQAMTDKFTVGVLGALTPDDTTRTAITNIYTILRKHGIGTGESLNIMLDIFESFKDIKL